MVFLEIWENRTGGSCLAFTGLRRALPVGWYRYQKFFFVAHKWVQSLSETLQVNANALAYFLPATHF